MSKVRHRLGIPGVTVDGDFVLTRHLDYVAQRFLRVAEPFEDIEVEEEFIDMGYDRKVAIACARQCINFLRKKKLIWMCELTERWLVVKYEE